MSHLKWLSGRIYCLLFYFNSLDIPWKQTICIEFYEKLLTCFISKRSQQQYFRYWKSTAATFFWRKSREIQQSKSSTQAEQLDLWRCCWFLDLLSWWQSAVLISQNILTMWLNTIPMHMHPAYPFLWFLNFWYPSHTTHSQNKALVKSLSFRNEKCLIAGQVDELELQALQITRILG